MLISAYDKKLIGKLFDTNDRILKTYRCKGAGHCNELLAEFKTALAFGSFVLTFPDQVMAEVKSVVGVIDRTTETVNGGRRCGSRRFYIVLEIV